MAPEQVDVLHLHRRGIRGDRLWAVRDVERNCTASARRLPALLGFTARYLVEPDAHSGPGRVPPVVVTTPCGDEIESGDPRASELISAALDHEVRLESLGVDPATHRRSWRELVSTTPAALLGDFGISPDQATFNPGRMGWGAIVTTLRYATPPGAFVDLAPVHVLTESSLRALGVHLDGGTPDPRRFRANLLLATEGNDLLEAEWAHHELTAADGAGLLMTVPTMRCVVPSRAHEELPVDSALNRALATAAGRYLGCYADVLATGQLRLGDRMRLAEAREPGPVRAFASAGGRRVIDVGVSLADLVRRTGQTR